MVMEASRLVLQVRKNQTPHSQSITGELKGQPTADQRKPKQGLRSEKMRKPWRRFLRRDSCSGRSSRRRRGINDRRGGSCRRCGCSSSPAEEKATNACERDRHTIHESHQHRRRTPPWSPRPRVGEASKERASMKPAVMSAVMSAMMSASTVVRHVFFAL